MMKEGEETLVMGDCSINIDPSADDLVEITLQTAHTVRQFGIEPRIGLLSYSTLGSAKGYKCRESKRSIYSFKTYAFRFRC